MKQLKNYDAVLYELLNTLEELDVEMNDYPTIIYLHYDDVHKTGQIITHANMGNSYLIGDNLDNLMEYSGTYDDWTDFYMDWDVMDILEMADYDEPHHVLEVIAHYVDKHPEDVEPRDVLRWMEDLHYGNANEQLDVLHEYRDDYIRNDGECVNTRVRLATDLLENYVMTDLEELERLDRACDRIMEEIRNRGEQ